MNSKQIHTDGAQRTFAVILKAGDDVMERLEAFAKQERLSAAEVSAIGAFSSAELYFFDWQKKEYLSIPVDEQVEVASLLGDVVLDEGGVPTLHLHAVLGKRDGSAVAGHLAKGIVRPTLEILVTESPRHLRRRKDPETGLALIHPED